MNRNFDLLIVSDTHGRTDSIKQVFTQLNFRPWAVLFLGDCLRDLVAITSDPRYGELSVYSVAGNCDKFGFFPPDAPNVRTVMVGELKILMMHGDTFSVKRGLGEAQRYAAAQGADVLLYGHTHAPYIERLAAGDYIGGGVTLTKPLLVANPGSLGEPRYGQDPSFGVLTVRDGQALFSHGVLNN